MARDIVDDRLIGALHVRALTRAGLQHDTVDEHVAVQAGTLAALLEGGYDGDATLAEVRDQVDRAAREVPGAADDEVVAVRATGRFSNLRLRSVARQHHPYPPLREVVAHQTEWQVDSAVGTVVGFRFPDTLAGVEVPGYHVHFLSDDRTAGGHVIDLTMLDGDVQVQACDDLHVELPVGVSLGTPGAVDLDEVQRVEGGGTTS